jgi:hypothetical protein
MWVKPLAQLFVDTKFLALLIPIKTKILINPLATLKTPHAT